MAAWACASGSAFVDPFGTSVSPVSVAMSARTEASGLRPKYRPTRRRLLHCRLSERHGLFGPLGAPTLVAFSSRPPCLRISRRLIHLWGRSHPFLVLRSAYRCTHIDVGSVEQISPLTNEAFIDLDLVFGSSLAHAPRSPWRDRPRAARGAPSVDGGALEPPRVTGKEDALRRDATLHEIGKLLLAIPAINGGLLQ